MDAGPDSILIIAYTLHPWHNAANTEPAEWTRPDFLSSFVAALHIGVLTMGFLPAYIISSLSKKTDLSWWPSTSTLALNRHHYSTPLCYKCLIRHEVTLKFKTWWVLFCISAWELVLCMLFYNLDFPPQASYHVLILRQNTYYTKAKFSAYTDQLPGSNPKNAKPTKYSKSWFLRCA